jgi:hypothetical protein
MDKRIVWLLSALVVIVAIGVGLYANELSRQAAQRRAVVRAAQEVELENRIQGLSGPIATFCHPGNENIKSDIHAKPNRREWDKWQCENAKAASEDNAQALRKLREENR